MVQVDDLPFLLEPLKPVESGCGKPRKCAVIDLDETLVHSSFAVRLVFVFVCFFVAKLNSDKQVQAR